MTHLRLAFMGTPDFAVPALYALHEAGHEIAAVYCQPPRPAGRGQHEQKTPVHLAAESLGLPVFTPKSLRKEEEQDKLRALALDVIVVAAYGLILPQAVLDAPRLGCLNIHASLLPRWRGAAPIHRALLAGDAQTGITIMQMDAGLDTGPMLLQESLPLTDETRLPALHDAMAALGGKMILRALDGVAAGTLPPTPQSEDGMTYAAKLTREDGRISWMESASDLARKVRALTPWPGTFFLLGDEPVKILEAALVPTAHKVKPGTLLDDQLTLACGADALRLLRVQRAGKKPTDGASFLRGLRLPVGEEITSCSAGN